jgi:hypothetical protein
LLCRIIRKGAAGALYLPLLSARQMSKDREEFIKKERAKSGVRNSFDSVVAESLKAQLAAKGFK